MLAQRLALPALLLLAAALRLWRLDQNGFGNEYYSAAVRSMGQSWHNFLYHAFDPAGFISVDKPPLALWIQVAGVKVFGFNGLAILVPQVLQGVASVWLVSHLVQRRFGRAAGLLAGLFLALTPVSVAIDRSSNTDTCLVLVLLLAAWALLRAAEDGSRRFLLLSMALVGLAFNVKMLVAAGALLAIARRTVASRLTRTAAMGALATGLLAVLILPGAWALSSVLVPGPGILPSADLARLVPGYADARPRRALDPEGLTRLVEFLSANRRGERYLVATSTVMLAGPLIIRTGEPVMARGGFHGLDPILTPDRLARLVQAGELRFVMLGDLSLVNRRMGAETAGQPIADWVRANGKPVDPNLWRMTRRGAMTLYDLRPDRGLTR